MIFESPGLDIPTILSTPGIQVTHTLQTEGIPYSKEIRASSPSTNPFGDSSDASETSDRNEVGTRFEIKEDGNHIDYSFSEVKEVEGPITNTPANLDQPIFEKLFLTSDLTLRPDTFVLMGGQHRTEAIDDQPPAHLYRWFVLVRGSPEKAKIRIIPQTDNSFSNTQQPETFEDLDSLDIEIEVTPDQLALSGEIVSIKELLQKLEPQARNQKVLLKVAPSVKMERVQSVLEALKSEGFEQISISASLKTNE